MARLEMPAAQDLTPEQVAACDEAIAGLRGAVIPPMIPWLRNPELARRAQRLGELVRFQTSLGRRLTELAILVCARHWTSHTEWQIHKEIALKEGISPEIIAAIAAGDPPPLSDSKDQVVFAASKSLLSAGLIPDGLYRRAVSELGEKGLVELVGILGYYCLVALTLNAFEIGLPEGAAAELKDPDF